VMNKIFKVAFLIWIPVCFILLSVYFTHAKHINSEQYYQIKWCKDKGKAEVRLEDRTRVDCLTKIHAIEFDFAQKWAEAIGQALHYGLMTGKRPGIVLIIEDEKHKHYWYRLKRIIDNYKLPIDLWCYSCEGLE